MEEMQSFVRRRPNAGPGLTGTARQSAPPAGTRGTPRTPSKGRGGRSLRRTGLLLAGATLALLGCENAGEGRVLGIEATGVLEGVVYFDADGSLTLTAPDEAAPDVGVWLVAAGTVDTTAAPTSDVDGLYLVPDLPVGRYAVTVDTSTIGDTVVVARVDAADIELGPGDSVSVSIAVSFPTLSIEEARGAVVGTRMFVEGVALTNLGVYGDTTLHVADTSGALRAVRIARTDVLVGDSVRLRGVRSVRDGQPVLSDVTVFLIGVAASLPPAAVLTTAEAATAGQGVFDGGLVRVVGSTLLDSTTTSDGDVRLLVDDGSGALAVLLDESLSFNLGPFALPGAAVDALGVLVPVAAGEWALKPRSNADIGVTIEVSSTSEVRQLPLGTRVFVDGIALNSRGTFGDATVHLADTAGAVRATRVARATILPGDSIRMAGAIGRLDGQIVIDSAVPFVLGLAEPLPSIAVTTERAADANGGALDAALVKVSNATVNDTTRTPDQPDGEFTLLVADASGTELQVLIDRDATIAVSGQWVPGAVMEITGLLVPVPSLSGVWRLKPRVQGDLIVN